MPVSGAQTWLVVPGLEPGTEYQFSVLAQNKLGTGPFSEVVTVNTAGGNLVEAFFLSTPVELLSFLFVCLWRFFFFIAHPVLLCYKGCAALLELLGCVFMPQ